MRMTEPRYEALSALMPENRYLLRRDSAKLTKADRLVCLIRTNIIELVGHREKKIVEVSGQMAAWLEKEQVIKQIGERVSHGVLYQITDHGRKVFEECQQLIKSGGTAPWVKKQRVTERMVSSIAARYGCSIIVNIARHWYELERLDGKELLMPTICHPTTKRHIRKLGDMTPAEWSAAIARAALLKEPEEDGNDERAADQGVHPQPEI